MSERERSKASQSGSFRNTCAGFYCDLDIGFKTSIRQVRQRAGGRRTESHSNRSIKKDKEI